MFNNPRLSILCFICAALFSCNMNTKEKTKLSFVTVSDSVYKSSDEYKQNLSVFKKYYEKCANEQLYPDVFYLELQRKMYIGSINSEHELVVNKGINVLDTSNGKNIFDLLQMSVDEALEFFADKNDIARKIKPLQDVGQQAQFRRTHPAIKAEPAFGEHRLCDAGRGRHVHVAGEHLAAAGVQPGHPHGVLDGVAFGQPSLALAAKLGVAAEQTGVIVRDRIPSELRFVLANRGAEERVVLGAGVPQGESYHDVGPTDRAAEVSIDTYVRGVPHAFREVAAPEGTHVRIEIEVQR